MSEHERAVREDGLAPIGGFDEAIKALKEGYRVTRLGWNGKGMYLYLVSGSRFQVSRPPLDGIYPHGTEITYRPHIDMRYADGTCGVWVASHSDMLEGDWCMIVDDDKWR